MNDIANMPKYRCHKEVHALKIVSVTETSVGIEIFFDGDYDSMTLMGDYGRFRFRNKDSDFDLGYLVVYADGYQSWSPSDVFEEGYTLI